MRIPFLKKSEPAMPVVRRASPFPKVRRHTAAVPDRIAGGFSLSLSGSLAEEYRADLPGLIQHSRKLAQNNDYMRAFLVMCRRHMIGPHGIKYNPQARDARGVLDAADNKQLADAFKLWGKRGNCTVCGRFSWLEMQWIASMVAPRDGGVFIRFFRGKEYGPFGFQIQFLTVDRLDIGYSTDLRNGGYIHGGVECDELDRPVAWHFLKRKLNNGYYVSGDRMRVPASDIVYLALPEDYSVQLRMPWAHTAARRLNMFHGFEEAALTNARVGASKMGFIVRGLDADPGEIAAEANAETDEDGRIIEDVEPGSIETLPLGHDFRSFDPDFPNGEMAPFIKTILRGASAGLGVSYNGIANDLEGVNFSSLHVGKSEERDEWRILQTWLADSMHEQIKSEWLPMAILSGRLSLPFSKLEKFQATVWRPRGWRAVNPLQEASANVSNVESGFTSPQRVAAQTGEDIDQIYEEIAAAKAKAEELGIEFQPIVAPMFDDKQ